MYGVPLNYIVIGAEVKCPDCFRIMASDNDLSGRGTLQKTLFRNYEESDSDFWKRVLESSRKMVGPMGFYASVVIFCRYNSPFIPNVEIYDNRQNHIRSMLSIAQQDPSHKVRVKALCGLADMFIAEDRRAKATCKVEQ
ncbi:MAG: hypothetical protein EOO38_12610 [Cytophagaceae bacterium]|nr:MAG: hypothetical protein EOO38_12610 [Cytophagaceae bacterium]